MTIGMGDVLNCPGDPACPGYVDPGTNAAIQAAISAAIAPVPSPAAVATPPAGQWFSGVSNSTILIAGGILAVALFFGGKRR